MTTLNETRTGSALTDDEIRAKYEAPFRHGAGLADSRAKRLAAAHFIESLREDGIPISRACRIFGMPRSSFYYRKENALVSVRKRLESNLELAQRIRAAQEAAGWTLGSRRVAEALKHDGYPRKLVTTRSRKSCGPRGSVPGSRKRKPEQNSSLRKKLSAAASPPVRGAHFIFRPPYSQAIAPQTKSSTSCPDRIRRNIETGYTVE